MTSTDHDLGIARRVRAARERRGWSRETLAFHAGISWSAIRQLEAGRRRNLRPSTLAALAGALGVTVDYLVSGCPVSSAMLEHRVFLYEGDDEFLAASVPFLRQAAEGSEAALAVATEAHIALLHERLGSAQRTVEFADNAAWCDTPGRALRRLRGFVDGHIDAGTVWVRVLVEPLAAGRSAADARRWALYESLFNLVFRSTPLTALCAYDAAVPDTDVLGQALVTHPHMLGDAGLADSADYIDPVEFLLEPGAVAGGT
jgi:transcriptional regulator with XRE-family HTH domain